MTRRDYPPAFLRYLKARLSNLARPSFWMTAIFLSALGLVIKEYWANPDFLSQQESKQVASAHPLDSSLSQGNGEINQGLEPSRIAADIDSTPVLNNSAPQRNSEQLARSLEQNNNSKTLSKDSPSKIQDAKSTSSGDTGNFPSAIKTENPFLEQAENLLQGKSIQTEGKSSTNSFTLSGATPTPLSSIAGVGSLNQTNDSQNSTSVNPQIAQNQSINRYPQVLDGSTASVQLTPFAGQSLPMNNSAQQIIPSTTGVSTDATNLTTVTNYTQPQIPNQPQNPYSSINPYPYASAPSRYNVNRILNRYSNYSNFVINQQSSSVVPPTTLVPPSTSATSTYTTPYYTQTQNQGVVAPYNSATTNNYNINSWQQIPQRYQYNLSSPAQGLKQYPNRGAINNYSYP